MTEKKTPPPIFIQTSIPDQPELDRWQQVTEEEAKAVYEMTLRNELSGGTPAVREFEAMWRDWTGLRYAITTMNGTSALYCAYFGLGVGPGDEVICPTYTWICTIAPAVFLGARPVFVESDPDTLQIDPEDVRRKITEKTRAVVAVHLWGNVCDMDRLMEISRKTRIPVIEDCSHAHGAKYRGKAVGTIGDVGVWSLQGSKPVSAGEGGVLATNNSEIFERACLAGQVNRMGGLDLISEKFADLQPLGLGMKFRAHPLGIAIAKIQLRKLAALNARRRTYVEQVEESLHDCPGRGR
ncbi:MAG TPA: DegT/DnrJ/EryC1/StrS family aminotransferase [Acidobacteriota bacterium]|jgi:dTDP-4-amino-4,6-dideoxygalactose transaminase